MKSSNLESVPRMLSVYVMAGGLIFLTGCRGAPSVNVLGSFFPGWMLCMGFGAAGALLFRQVFVKIGVEAYLGPRPLIYFCLWIFITLIFWLMFFRS